MSIPDREPLEKPVYIVPPTLDEAEMIQRRISTLSNMLPSDFAFGELASLGKTLQLEHDALIDVGIDYSADVAARFRAMSELSKLALESSVNAV